MHDGGWGARLRVFCDLTELSNCTDLQLAIYMMGLHFSCNNKIFFLKNMDLGCLPCLCSMGLKDGYLLFLAAAAAATKKQVLSVRWPRVTAASRGCACL